MTEEDLEKIVNNSEDSEFNDDSSQSYDCDTESNIQHAHGQKQGKSSLIFVLLGRWA